MKSCPGVQSHAYNDCIEFRVGGAYASVGRVAAILRKVSRVGLTDAAYGFS